MSTHHNKDLEFEASTIEKAIELAVKQTGVSKDRLEIKIVCEESRGLFGMQGAKSAKIKVNIR